MDAAAVSQVFKHIDREPWIVTAADGHRRGGLVATFVAQASIVPESPRVLVGLAKQHHTTQLVEQSRSFAMHLIDEDQVDWVWRFGMQTGSDSDKFAGLTIRSEETGSPILTDALAYLDCRIETQLDTGDRHVYLAQVVAGDLQRNEPPLTMHRMLALAPPEKLQQLKEQLTRDARIDAEAIQQWRAQR